MTIYSKRTDYNNGSSNSMLSQETTCKGLQTMFVKTIQSAFKEIELFRYFSCMVSKKKKWSAYIKSFHSMI